MKNGRESRHFLEGDEIRQLKQLRRESPASRFVFCSERGGPLSNRSVHHIVKKAGEEAGLPFPIHPHMLRHAKGFQLAQSGTDTPDAATFAKRVVDAVRAAGMAERVTVQSFDWRTLREVKRLAPEIETSCITMQTKDNDTAGTRPMGRA